MCNTLFAVFTARTTWVSNPDRSPSFHPSLSDLFWLGAFATGSPPRIITFYRYPRNTPNPSQSQVEQSFSHVVVLSTTISQEIYSTSYGCFRPNTRSPLVAPGLPRLLAPVLPTTYSPKFLPLAKAYSKTISTWDLLITLSHSVKNSYLLHPVGLCPVPQ